jgi:hypothetical protein
MNRGRRGSVIEGERDKESESESESEGGREGVGEHLKDRMSV